MSGDEQGELSGLFMLPEGDNHPAIIAQRLLQLPEHAHLREGEATIEWLFRADPKIQAGRQILGTCYMPTVQGSLRDFFLWMVERLFGVLPDFLIVLDKGYWDTCGPRRREILVYHELLHAVHAVDKYDAPKFDKEGRPVWALKGHDVEEFSATVRRYGAWNQDIEQFVAAASEGGYA